MPLGGGSCRLDARRAEHLNRGQEVSRECRIQPDRSLGWGAPSVSVTYPSVSVTYPSFALERSLLIPAHPLHRGPGVALIQRCRSGVTLRASCGPRPSSRSTAESRLAP